jgi:hypothetical protein
VAKLELDRYEDTDAEARAGATYLKTITGDYRQTSDNGYLILWFGKY